MLENFTQLFQETLSQDEQSLTEKLEERIPVTHQRDIY